MAYKQNNNPFKKLHQDLQGFGQRHSAWKQKRKEASIGNDGLTSIERRRAEKKTRKAGESKFQADVRRRREGNRKSVLDKREVADPKSEINVKGANTPSWNYKTKHPLEYNPNDLRHNVEKELELPSAPGDPFTYFVTFLPDGQEYVHAWNNETEESATLGSWDSMSDSAKKAADKNERAIRKRYTGSETGDFKNWMKHNTWTTSDTEYPPTAENPDAKLKEWQNMTAQERKEYEDGRYGRRRIIREADGWTDRHEDTYEADYLPYDLAQKTHNPKYKGSKK